MIDIKKEVKSAFTENKTAVIASVLILFISLILGYVFEPYLHDYLSPVVQDLTNKVQTGVIQLTFLDIFLNNIMVALRMFILGIVFCFSAVILSFNGFFVGYYVALQDNLLRVLLYIIPHGIFEFSACILSCASGFVLFHFIVKFIKSFFSKKEMKFLEKFETSFDENFDKLKQAFILLLIGSILMVIAGFIEAYVTLPLGNYLLSILS